MLIITSYAVDWGRGYKLLSPTNRNQCPRRSVKYEQQKTPLNRSRATYVSAIDRLGKPDAPSAVGAVTVPIDVLTVLDAVIDGECMDADVMLMQASAAVAELMEAANAAADFQFAEVLEQEDFQAALHAHCVHKRSLRTALARCSGGSR